MNIPIPISQEAAQIGLLLTSFFFVASMLYLKKIWKDHKDMMND